MPAVVIQHINVMSAMKKYGKLKELNIIYAAFNWHISCFTFISGYVGYKTAKYSNLLYLWITTFFYSMGINIIFTLFIPKVYKHKFTLMDYFPVLSFKYWYFTEYFGMYLFLPVINKGIEYITKSQLKATIFSFIVVYVILQDYINPNFDCFKLQNGNSVLWLLIITSSPYEYNIFINNFNYSDKYIYKAGLAKYEIYNSIKKQIKENDCILVSFTYRSYNNIYYEKSMYKYNLMQLLNNDSLIKFLKAYNIDLIYIPHHHELFLNKKYNTTKYK